jgi:CxxC motif-containing protein (DUF1111 family)
LFQRKFTMAQGMGPGVGDGGGDIEVTREIGAGVADSCAACHGRPRGSGGVGGDVVTRPDSRDAIHLFGLGLKEMLADEITADLRRIRASVLALATKTRTTRSAALVSKGISYGLITASADGQIDSSQVIGVDEDLRVRPFFWHGGTVSIREFIVGAFNAEMGIQIHDPVTAAASGGSRAVSPAGMVLDGSTDRIEAPPAGASEVDPAVVDFLEFYLLNYFKPGHAQQTTLTRAGRFAFEQIGCASCHKPNLTIANDRRVADVETVYDAKRGIINRLFSTAAGRYTEIQDVPGQPSLKRPAGGAFVVRDIFTDFKRHDLGPEFQELEYDGSVRRQFLTAPLWGVGSTGPYGHDGRSINLMEVILRHGGEAEDSRDRFAALPLAIRQLIVDFLNTLILFPPDDTASNLDPGDRSHPLFPLIGHGSIKLSVLFNDPRIIE